MKNPAIKEGGSAKVFNGIKRLYTRQSNSDDKIPWVPESERQLTTKYITQNGVYKASDEGYYAFSEVTVSVPLDEGVTGEGDDGEQHYVAPDPETGELTDTVLADKIAITANAQPNYVDGDPIDISGVQVKAFIANGELWTNERYPDGIVPTSELMCNPTVAVYDANSALVSEITQSEEYDDLAVPMVNIEGVHINLNPQIYYAPDGIDVDFPAGFDKYMFMWKKGSYRAMSMGASSELSASIGSYVAFTHGGKTVYYSYADSIYPNILSDVIPNCPEWTDDQISMLSKYGRNEDYSDVHESDRASYGMLAWSMVYDPSHFYMGGGEVTILWPRYNDGFILETSFNIVVEPNRGSGSGSASDITFEEVDEAIRTSQLLGIDVVYIRGVEYTMADALVLWNHLRE